MGVEDGSRATEELVDAGEGLALVYDGLTVEDQGHCLLFGIISLRKEGKKVAGSRGNNAGEEEKGKEW